MVWAPDYITVAEFKASQGITDVLDDGDIGVWITAASRAIDAHCHRQFGNIAAAGARVYRRQPYWDDRLCLWVLPIDDVQDTTGMTVGGVALASSGVTLLPDNAVVESRPYERIGFGQYAKPTMPLTIIARWGWSAVPTQVKGATRIQTNRFLKRRESPFGVAGSMQAGSEIRLLSRVDPDVGVALRGLGRDAP